MVSNPYVDESEQGAKLLIDHPLDFTHGTTTAAKRKEPTGEPRPRGRPRKIQAIETNAVEHVSPTNAEKIIVEAEHETEHPPTHAPSNEKSDVVAEKAMSATEVSSKIRKPRSYEEAIADPVHSRRWKETIEEEIQNIENHHTWEYDNLPPGRKAVGSKWFFKVKYHPDGTVARYKIRLVAQGFSQVHGIDFDETFSPTVRRESSKIFLAISCLLNLIVEQVDIVGAYLESLLTDNKLPIFMKLPPGMEAFRSIRAGLVVRLLRSICGLRQSGRLWNQKVIAFFKSLGFRALNADPCILVRQTEEEGTILVGVYVDDFLLAAKQREPLDWIKKSLKEEYNVKI